MADLPVLVVHGGWIWLAALAFAVLAMPALAAGSCGLRERGRSARLRSMVSANRVGTIRARPGLAAASEVLARGSLGLGLPDVEEPGVSDRARWVELVTAQGRFALLGTIEVRLGSRESWRGGIEVRSIEDGDSVRVEAPLVHRVSASATAGYRDDAGEWALDSPVVAFEGVPRGPVRRAAGRGLVVGVAAWLAIFVGGGEVAATDLEAPVGEAWPLAIHVAAASPLRRDEALAEMSEALARRPFDWVDQEALLAVETLRGRPEEAIRFLLSEGAVRRALVLEEARGDAGSFAWTAPWHYAIGDFRRASDAYVRFVRESPRFADRLEPRVHLLAGRPGLAAGAARRVARSAISEREAAVEEAVALAIEARAGDPAARAALEADREAPEGIRAVLLADLVQGTERLRRLEGRTDRLAWWLRLEVDPLGTALAIYGWPWFSDRHAAIRERGRIALAALVPTDDRARAVARRLQSESERFAEILRPTVRRIADLPPDYPLMASRTGIIGDGVGGMREIPPTVDSLDLARAAALRPVLGSGSAEIDRWIRGGRIGECLDCPVWRLLDDLAERKDAARDAPDPDVLGELDVEIMTFGDALLRRDIAVPLAVLEDLY